VISHRLSQHGWQGGRSTDGRGGLESEAITGVLILIIASKPYMTIKILVVYDIDEGIDLSTNDEVC
jgi:hypothetical protein